MKKLAMILITAALAVLALADPPTYAQLDRLIEAVNKGNSSSGVDVSAVNSIVEGKGYATTTYVGDQFTTNNASLIGVITNTASKADYTTNNVALVNMISNTVVSSTFTVKSYVTVAGVSNTTTTTAMCTNRLTFVSEPDSNVKFTVKDMGGGNVQISVGVYYK